ncbi:hypothetical protein, partial [Pantoea agglomerans]
TPKTHLVPQFCGAGGSAVVTKHFLSASVTVRPLLVMSPYLGTGLVEGKLTGKKSRLNGLIKRRSGWVHTFKPERRFSFAEPGQAQLQYPIIKHGFSFEQSCE